jgi:hypothetical protein
MLGFYHHPSSAARVDVYYTYRTRNILSQFLPVTYRMSGSSDTDMPLRTSAPFFRLSFCGQRLEKSASLEIRTLRRFHPYSPHQMPFQRTVFLVHSPGIGIDTNDGVFVPNVSKYTPPPVFQLVNVMGLFPSLSSDRYLPYLFF